MALVCAADEGANGRDANYGAAWRRLGGKLLCAGLDGVEGAGEVGGQRGGPEVF